jgi:hypothetical protein
MNQGRTAVVVQEPSLRPQAALRRVLAFAFSSGSSNRTLLRRVADRSGQRFHQAKRENRKTILPYPYRGVFEDECLQTIFEVRFFPVRRNSEEFGVILGILRNRSERSGSLRYRQELMEFPVKGWRKHSV